MSPANIKPDDIIDIFQKESRGKYGIICLDGLLSKLSEDELVLFQKHHDIEFDYDVYTKLGYLLNLGIYYYNKFQEDSVLKEQFSSALDYMGSDLLEHDLFKSFLIDFDYISRQELIDIFADYCADLGMSVFNTVDLKEYFIDLYLTTTIPKLRTEAIFLRTGVELNEDVYINTLDLIQKASSIAIRTVFVTTPVGAYKIGLSRLIDDMEKFNAWLYIIDPYRMKIFGIIKGGKPKNYNESQRDQFLQNLPRESIRSPSQVKKISMYSFNENESYRSHLFTMYSLITEEEFEKQQISSEQEHKYREIFKNLIVIEKGSGIALLNYASEEQAVSEHMLSSFLTAMDNFVAEIGTGGSLLEDINYQGFYIQAVYAVQIKIALFLSEPSDQVLKERLSFFIKYIENRYIEQILKFKNTMELSLFDDDDFIYLAKKILKI
jgi:hypothetical protein